MFSHYNYKCKCYFPSAASEKKPDKKVYIFSNRSEINLDVEHQTSYICIYTDNKEIEKFNFGITFSFPGSNIKSRNEDRLFLNFITKGKGTVNGIPFSKGQLYYTLPLQAHTVESDPKEPYASAWMSIEGTYAQDIINELKKLSADKLPLIEAPSDIMKLTKTLLYETNLGEMSLANLKALISFYLSFVTPTADEDHIYAGTTTKTAKLIKESKSYVRKNLKSVSVASMAAAQHYNKKYFSRVFTEVMGMTPIEYITDCRLEWAKNSLIHSNLSIAEITEAIGYNHRNGFYIAFRKKYGCNPTEYRKNHQTTE